MAVMLSLFLMVVPYTCGALIRRICRDREEGAGETYLVGVLALFFIWEVLSVGAVYLGLSFRLIVRIYSGILLAVTTLSLFLERGRMHRLRAPALKFSWTKFFTVVLFLAQIALYIILKPDTETDYTLENVRTILKTDLVYAYHPGTGELLPYPMSLRGKLQSLVPFYAYLSALVGDPAVVVYRLAPAWCFAMCLVAYSVLLEIAIPDREEGQDDRAYCMLILQLLLFFGSLSGKGIFYMQLHRGYRGETWVFAVLLPYLIYLCYRIFHGRSALRVAYLMMGITVSVMWADLRECTVQLVLMVSVSFGIFLLSLIGRKGKAHGG